MVKETTTKTLSTRPRLLLSKLPQPELDSELKLSELYQLDLQRAFEKEELKIKIVVLG